MASDYKEISGKHLEDFIRYLQALSDRHSEREKALLQMRDAPEKPERYVQDLLDAARSAEMYGHLSDQIRDIKASNSPSLNGQQLLDFINSFRGRETQPKPISPKNDPTGNLAAFQAQLGKQLFEVSLNSLESIKLEVREHALKTFLRLYHLQENKLVEWICKDILKTELNPTICTGGILNITELKKTLALPVDIKPECIRTASSYLFALHAYQQRVLPGGPLDVYEKAAIQYKRATFEAAVERAYPQGTLNVLPELQKLLLTQAAMQCGLDLNKLQRNISF